MDAAINVEAQENDTAIEGRRALKPQWVVLQQIPAVLTAAGRLSIAWRGASDALDALSIENIPRLLVVICLVGSGWDYLALFTQNTHQFWNPSEKRVADWKASLERYGKLTARQQRFVSFSTGVGVFCGLATSASEAALAYAGMSHLYREKSEPIPMIIGLVFASFSALVWLSLVYDLSKLKFRNEALNLVDKIVQTDKTLPAVRVAAWPLAIFSGLSMGAIAYYGWVKSLPASAATQWLALVFSAATFTSTSIWYLGTNRQYLSDIAKLFNPHEDGLNQAKDLSASSITGTILGAIADFTIFPLTLLLAFAGMKTLSDGLGLTFYPLLAVVFSALPLAITALATSGYSGYALAQAVSKTIGDLLNPTQDASENNKVSRHLSLFYNGPKLAEPPSQLPTRAEPNQSPVPGPSAISERSPFLQHKTLKSPL